MQENKNWFLIHIREDNVHKIADLLKRKKIETYWPMSKVNRDTETKNSAPAYRLVFPDLAFVKIAESEIPLVKTITGVINFLYRLNEYALVPEEDIQAMRTFLELYDDVTSQKSTICMDNQAEPDDEHFDDENLNDKIFLSSIGCYMVSKVNKPKEVFYRAV